MRNSCDRSKQNLTWYERSRYVLNLFLVISVFGGGSGKSCEGIRSALDASVAATTAGEGEKQVLV